MRLRYCGKSIKATLCRWMNLPNCQSAYSLSIAIFAVQISTFIGSCNCSMSTSHHNVRYNTAFSIHYQLLYVSECHPFLGCVIGSWSDLPCTNHAACHRSRSATKIPFVRIIQGQIRSERNMEEITLDHCLEASPVESRGIFRTVSADLILPYFINQVMISRV